MHIRIMGDPHGHLDLEEDGYWWSLADLGLCTGDFGYRIEGQGRWEAVQVMEGFRALGVRTILGNHDGVNHHRSLIYGNGEEDPGIQTQLEVALGSCNMGFGREEFEGWTLVGGRPYSNGNPGIVKMPPDIGELTIDKSANKIVELMAASESDNILLLTHNGPAGMGDEADSICGRDWKSPSADWGDVDLKMALENTPTGKNVMAVVMGHMHHKLRGGKLRRRIDFFGDVPVVNAAVVPRVVRKGVIVSRDSESVEHDHKLYQEHRHFLDLEIDQVAGRLVSAVDYWARKGSRTAEGITLPLYKARSTC